jgi:hypothetical protein
MSWFPDPESGDEGELLALLKKKYEEGEKEAVLTILFVHLEHGLPLPPWLTTAFCDAYDRYLNFEVKSLDELFGGAPQRNANRRSTPPTGKKGRGFLARTRAA